MEVTERTEALYETAEESERVDEAVSEYFGKPVSYPLFVAEVWQDGDAISGQWITLNKYVTPNDLRLLVRSAYASAITVVVGTRRADFQLSELVS